MHPPRAGPRASCGRGRNRCDRHVGFALPASCCDDRRSGAGRAHPLRQAGRRPPWSPRAPRLRQLGASTVASRDVAPPAPAVERAAHGRPLYGRRRRLLPLDRRRQLGGRHPRGPLALHPVPPQAAESGPPARARRRWRPGFADRPCLAVGGALGGARPATPCCVPRGPTQCVPYLRDGSVSSELIA